MPHSTQLYIFETAELQSRRVHAAVEPVDWRRANEVSNKLGVGAIVDLFRQTIFWAGTLDYTAVLLEDHYAIAK